MTDQGKSSGVCGCGEKRPHLHGEFVKRDGTTTYIYYLPQDEDSDDDQSGSTNDRS